MSGLDWFPSLVAAAGNPNIAAELKKGKSLGDRTYKAHLDGYDQRELITGKGASKRNEVFYFAEGTLGAVRLGDYKYRFIDQPQGWLGGTVHVDWPMLANLRLDPFERTSNPACVFLPLSTRQRGEGRGGVRIRRFHPRAATCGMFPPARRPEWRNGIRSGLKIFRRRDQP